MYSAISATKAHEEKKRGILEEGTGRGLSRVKMKDCEYLLVVTPQQKVCHLFILVTLYKAAISF